eukprot:6796695-Pyramimonas_sp.AAC.1
MGTSSRQANSEPPPQQHSAPLTSKAADDARELARLRYGRSSSLSSSKRTRSDFQRTSWTDSFPTDPPRHQW